MFAQRLAQVAPSATLKAAAEAERLRRAGHKVIDFTAGEPDFPRRQSRRRQAAIEAKFTLQAAAAFGVREAIVRATGTVGVEITAAEVLLTTAGAGALHCPRGVVQYGDEVITTLLWPTIRTG